MRYNRWAAWAALIPCFTASLVNAANLAPAPVTAARLAAAGNGRGAPACALCHGANGEGNALIGFPRLAGLPERYLTDQLENFATGRRSNVMMTPIARTLSVEERAATANFYAHLIGQSHSPASSPTTSDAPTTTTGETLAVRGRWSQGVPACAQCHGRTGQGVGDSFPALAAQPALYLENQLLAWQSGIRDPGPLGLMGAIAKKLSADDVTAVAIYLSALPPRTGDPAP